MMHNFSKLPHGQFVLRSSSTLSRRFRFKKPLISTPIVQNKVSKRWLSVNATYGKTHPNVKIIEDTSISESQSTPTTHSWSPTLQKYIELKKLHPGLIPYLVSYILEFLLMMRIGDFFEMFYEDAVKAAQALDITLTQYRKDASTPMCGIPAHSVDNYIERLIKKGILVAICDQVEEATEAKKHKRLITREITRLVTPGTLVEDRFLHPRKSNFLASIVRDHASNTIGISWVDLSTGEFHFSSSTDIAIKTDLTRIHPSELLVTEDLVDDPNLKPLLCTFHMTVLNADNEIEPDLRLKKLYETDDVASIGDFTLIETQSANLLLKYLEITQKDKLPHLSLPQRFVIESSMSIDSATRKSLELISNLQGEREGSVLSVIDKTITGAGARLLLSYFNSPLTSITEINKRLDAIEFFVKNRELVDQIRVLLTKTYDIKRCLQRLYLGRGTPRDLSSIGSTIAEVERLKEYLVPYWKKLPILLKAYLKNCVSPILRTLIKTLSKAIVDEPMHSINEGGFIAAGYSDELDELRRLQSQSQQVISELQAKYRRLVGLNSLRIRKNGIIGYYIEVPSVSKPQVQKASSDFQLYQSTVNVVRFKTNELRTLEDKINSATVNVVELEKKIFSELVQTVCANGNIVELISHSLAGFDVCTSLAALAIERNYTRPIVNNSLDFKVIGGRHPTVEAIQGESGGQFVSNDCVLTAEKRFWLITGPNMGGKSTFLRQNAIISILAQMGSYVPAKQAEIGIVDAIFSRIGAGDDITHDRSTFMVEMIESAHILNTATSKSLVIMDEVGRGTSTYDGLSIAWAVIESLYFQNKCRSLFATHYHELTELEKKLKNLACKTLAIKEVDGNVVFLYKIVTGITDKSYGIHVAQLAGMPTSVVERARVLLQQLMTKSKSHLSPSIERESAQDIQPTTQIVHVSEPSFLEKELESLEVNELSPRQAMNLLFAWKKKLKSQSETLESNPQSPKTKTPLLKQKQDNSFTEQTPITSQSRMQRTSVI